MTGRHEVVCRWGARGVPRWIIPTTEGKHFRRTRLGALLTAHRWNRTIRRHGSPDYGQPMRWEVRTHPGGMNHATRSALPVVPCAVLSARMLEDGRPVLGTVFMALGALGLWLAVDPPSKTERSSS